ncbi:hypothetical protein VOI54_13860 [Tamlana sp. 2201CG12-4]|uniref:hypothetical protein n=1 Tax=Tamlana sp. 2201CG12-4 TaxID=3112582 RepID=UPI002DB5633A|nr:hypothetical protein [Tamlana sp. 2201CG12-4]MEC3908111.1 hypothetical protein [Tamlana sp. 2201CG12-4]
MIMRILGRLFVAIDQLGNVLAGGNPDNTISARVGYFANFGVKKYRWYWKMLEKVINTTFWPLDGENHCLQAYYNDAGEKFEPGGYAWIYFILNILIVLSCIPLFLLFYLLYTFGFISPKRVNRLQDLKHRLESSERKLAGIKSEFEKTKIQGDSKVLGLIDDIMTKATEIKTIIAPQIEAQLAKERKT